MSKPSESKPGDLRDLRDRLIGLGEQSMRKSYYPELRHRLVQLERFRALLDQSTDAVFLVELPGGAVADFNQAALGMAGLDPEALPGEAFASFFSEEDGGRLAWGMEGRGRSMLEAWLRPRFGAPLRVEISLSRVGLAEGEYVVAVVRDVTERSRAQDALRDSEERYRALFAAAGDAIFVVRNGRLVEANARAEALFGLPREQLLGLTPADLSPSHQPCGRSSAELVRERLAQALDGRTAIFEWVHRRTDGAEFHVEVSLSSFSSASGDYVLAVVRDVTERKCDRERLAELNRRLEDLVEARTRDLTRKAQDLEAANLRLRELDGMKSAFLSSVSHELRTPLTSVLGFAKLIRKEFERSFLPLAAGPAADRTLPDRARRIDANLAIIEREGERLTRLINDVLDLSRIESGGMEWRDRELDPAELAAKAAEAVRGQFDPNPDLSLRNVAAPDLPRVYADPDRLLQVLLNLLTNAAKFTARGRVELRVLAPRPDAVRFEVQDTGPGIAAHDLARIFESFQQAGPAIRPDTPAGAGLGLAICREIVGHYRGRVWAESRLGEGSLFVVELPAIGSGSLPVRPESQRVGRDKPLVLVVDDDDALRSFLCQVLEDKGYAVLGARDGIEALQVAAAHEPDLITMDMLMPGMDGATALRRLREQPRLARIPVLVLSVLSQTPPGLEADAALNKPVDSERLLSTVAGLLHGSCRGEPVLTLGDAADPGLQEMLREGTLGAAEVIGVAGEQELWARLDAGFNGTVALPASLAWSVDMAALTGRKGVRVIILPEAFA